MILESQSAVLFSRPRLSDAMRDRLARNAWWIALVVLIVTILTFVLVGVVVTLLHNALANAFTQYTPAQRIFFGVLAATNVAATLSTIVLLAMAVGPLRRKARRGWSLTYVVTLLQLAFVTIIPLVGPLCLFFIPSFRFLLPEPGKMTVSFSTTMLVPVLALYCLMQVRDRFVTPAHDTKG